MSRITICNGLIPPGLGVMLGAGFECHLFIAFLLLTKGIPTDKELSASLSTVPPSRYQMDGWARFDRLFHTRASHDVMCGLGGRGQQLSLTRELQARKHSELVD